MKNFVQSMLFAALFVAGVSCEKQFEGTVEVQSENLITAEAAISCEVFYEEALARADALFAGIDGATTRAGSRRVKSHELFCSGKRFTRTEPAAAEAKFHIINYEDNAGFVMVAADKRATDIYAYSHTGNLNVDDAIENSGFGVFMEGAVALYAQEVDRPFIPGDTTNDGFIDLPGDKYGDIPYLAIEVINGVTYRVRLERDKSISKKSPLVSVKWHQANPYNYYCPSCRDYEGTNYAGKCAAGCGPVAAAQIMSYHKYPASHAGYEFDWSVMNVSPSYDDEPDDNILMIAHLIREIGRKANASYGQETNAYASKMKTAFVEFGYNVTGVDDYDVNKVKASVYNNRPVFAFGGQKSGSGHFWVIDGYDHLATRKTYYYNYAPYNVYDVRDFDNRIYVHCNWGWSSETYNKNTDYYDDAYFLSGAFEVTRKNQDGSEETFTYTVGNKILYNIYPKQ